MANIVIKGFKATWGLILQGFGAGLVGQYVRITRVETEKYLSQKLSTEG